MKNKNRKPITQKFVKKDNICNICQQEAILSEDHVPPKACPPLKDRIINILLYEFTNERGFKPRNTQNGVLYKTICSDCNNKLGINYDRRLGEFSRQIEKFVETKLELPPAFQVECYPNAIMRSVLGHLLAAKTETDNSEIDRLIRPCILDDSIPIPQDINIFYWVYPYERTIILRDFGMPSIRGNLKTFGIFNLLKFYPVAFLVSHKCVDYESLHNLNSFKKLSPKDVACIDIDLTSTKKSSWPEECNGLENFLMIGKAANDSVYSVPRSNKK
ncbi:hypothetical protein POG22_09860 [Geitlerinema sp. CS-897]|nr:hypothetical protein [Geitlerinema sp. CS-897]